MPPDRVGRQGDCSAGNPYQTIQGISSEAGKSKEKRGLRTVWPQALVAVLAVSLLPAATQQPLRAQDTTSGVSGISVEESEQLFTVLCALDAAGFSADESTLAEMPERLSLRTDLLKQQGPATEAIRKFYRDHAIGDSGQMLSRYVTFALTIGPPPRFSFEVPEDALPPEALVLQDLQPLLATFYREANLASRWQRIEAGVRTQRRQLPVCCSQHGDQDQRISARSDPAIQRARVHGLRRAAGWQAHEFPQPR